MSIVVVTFQGAPKLSDEAIKKEAELDAKIEAKIIGVHHILFILIDESKKVCVYMYCDVLCG